MVEPSIQPEVGEFVELSPLELEFSNRAGMLLRQFGHQQLSRLAQPPEKSFGALPDDQILNFGDKLQLVLRGQLNEVHSVWVNRDGMIIVPRLSSLRAAGLPFSQVREAIQNQARDRLFETSVDVSLSAVAAVTILVTGEVRIPGRHQTTSLSKAIDIIAAAGGPNPGGSLRRIQLRRDGKSTSYIDLYPLLTGIGEIEDPSLQPGDRLIVPAAGPSIAVAGHVGRPGIFEMSDDDPLTIIDALRLAGSLTQARASNLYLQRVSGDGRDTVTPIQSFDQLLQPGDIVLAKRQVASDLNALIVSGHITNPGPFSLSNTSKLSQIVKQFRFGPEPYLPFAILETKSSDAAPRQLSGIDLAQVLRGQFDLELSAGAQLWVLSERDVAFLNSNHLKTAVLESEESDHKNIIELLDGRHFEPKLAADDKEGHRQAMERQLSDSLFSRKGAQMHQGQFSYQIAAQSAACNSLAYISYLTSSSGGERFRVLVAPDHVAQPESAMQMDQIAQLLQANGEAGALSELFPQKEEKETAEEVQPRCPDLFDQNPKVLAMILDHSARISGAVTHPGLYPVTSGTSLETLMMIAGGATPEGEKGKVEIAHFIADRDASRVNRRTVGQLTEVAGSAIRPGDVIRLYKGQPNRNLGTVVLSGQFVEPGVYEIGPGETLLQVIDRAGGLTEHAYPYGAVFMRESVRQREQEGFNRAADYLQSSIISALARASSRNRVSNAIPAMQSLIAQIRTTKAAGRIVMVADPAVLQVQPELDLILEAGDHLHMPSRPNSVAVNGQVLSPTSLLFRSGQDVDDYIDQAGGFARDADKSRAFAILPNGSARRLNLSAWNYQETYLPPGSTIVVPRDLVPFDPFDLTERLTSIVSQVALSAAALNSLDD